MSYAINKGIRIHYKVIGSGPPLLLHHGFSDCLESWYEYGYVDTLADQYQLILVDGRGHGASDKPYSADSYGMEPRAEDMIAVLDDLTIEKVNYFGYSMGGWVGFCLAQYASERVNSLILGGIHPYGQDMGFYRRIIEQGIPGLEQLVREMAEPYSPTLGRFRQNDTKALAAAVANDRPDIFDILPDMTMPCLLLAGTDDPIHPLVERCSKELSNGSFLSVSGLNHFQTMLCSNRLIPTITDFLATAT